MEDPRSDADLLRELRNGDRDAYVVLWERHIGAALRYSRRMLPSRAEDLASEALLAIYQQVTTTSKGPDFAFRSYLKAVIRNTAIRWRKEASRFDEWAEADAVDFSDGLSLVERESDASDLLGAFQDLPERWQKVLWLSEVAEVARPEIARELGIKPNAVSALHRRARSGLRLQWLSRQVPVLLRDDETHVARLLPRHLSDPNDEVLTLQIAPHLETCSVCSDLLVSLQTDARRLQGVTLSAAGFGALSVALPGAGALAPTTAVASGVIIAGAGVGIAGLLSTGAGVLVVTAGVLAVGGILLGSFFLNPGEADAARPETATAPTPASTPSELPLDRIDPLPPATPTPTPSPEPPALGRGNTDPNIESIEFDQAPAGQYVPVAPAPAGPEVPGPSEEPGGEPALTPGVTSPTDVTGYTAPFITGQTAPGNAVAIDFASQRYEIDVEPDGSWSFDTRPLAFDAGSYDYAVWAYSATEQSLATTGTIVVQPPAVQGFEQIDGPIPLDEAQTTGIVVSITGPPNGTVWVSTPKTDATVTLDENGHAVRRIRMFADGWYPFSFAVIDADWYAGPAFSDPVDVVDPNRDPSLPRGGGGVFDIVDP
ncbi:RNA polymerase sigma factor [Microbacterium esteraromaticum]|nr:sigma-70 family RNA polymerase sigma factor [Microbacterium esteraromaticum]